MGVEALASLLPEGLGALPALFLIVASFLTSALTAAFGIGGGVTMLVLLGLFVPVTALIPVHGLIQLGSNTGRAWHRRAHIFYGIAAPFLAGSAAGVAAGAFMVVQLPDAMLKIVLGGFVLTVTWAKIPGLAGLGRAGLAVGSAVLALAGMFVGATGPLLAAFIAQRIGEDRKALVATLAAGMAVQHALKVAAFAVAGFAFAQWVPLVAVMIVTGYIGTLYGGRLLDKLPEERFRRWFRIGLSLLALDLVRRGITALL